MDYMLVRVVCISAILLSLQAAAATPTTGPGDLLDLEGKPLPHGAVLRLGSSKFAGDPNARDLSPDGTRVVTICRTRPARIWNAETGALLFSIGSGEQMPMMAAFIGNDLIATSSLGMQFELYDAHAGALVQSFAAKDIVRKIVGSDDGKRMVVVADQVALWDVPARTIIADLAEGKRKRNQQAPEISFSRDGQRVLMAAMGRASIWNAGDGSSVVTPEIVRSEDGSSLSPDGMQVGSVHTDVSLTDLKTGIRRRPLPEVGFARGISFHPTSKLLAFYDDEKVYRWNWETGQPLATIEPRNGGGPVRWSADGKRALLGPDVVDGETLEPVFPTKSHRSSVTACAVSPDGEQILTGDQMGTLIQWDATTGKPLADLPRHNTSAGISTLDYFADGKAFIEINGFEAVVRDSRWLDLVGRNVRNNRHTLAMSANGAVRALFHANADQIQIVRYPEGTLLRAVPTQKSQTGSVALSPDGSRAAINFGGPVQVIDVANGKEIHSLLLEQNLVGRSMAWSHGGGAIAVGGSPLQLVDATNGAVRWKATNGGSYRRVSFSADDMFIAAFSLDHLDVYESATGSLLVTIPGIDSRVASAGFSPDDRRLVVGYEDSTVLVWDLTRLLLDKTNLSTPPDVLAQKLGDPEARLAFAAGAQLVQIHPQFLIDRSGGMALPNGMQPDWDALISQLGDADPQKREQAHLQLERGGQGAGVAVARALSKPPAGEAGDRLKSIARVLGVTPMNITATVDSKRLESVRLIKLLEWVGTEPAVAVLERLADHGSRQAIDAAHRLKKSLAPTTRP